MLIAKPQLCQIDYDRLIQMAQRSRGDIDSLILHWTAGHYHQVFDDYHLSVDNYGRLYAPVSDLTEVLEHTWHRNQGTVGIALCCAFRAQANNGFDTDFGPEPPTALQIETLSRVVSILTQNLELPITPETVLTHCEAAAEDGYGPGSGDPETRWDLWYLPDWPYRKGLHPGGEVLRGKAAWYQVRSSRNGREVKI